MATYNDANIGGILAAEAIPQYARVFLNASGKGELAAITERDIGTAENDVFADGDDLTIRWRNAQGTRKCRRDRGRRRSPHGGFRKAQRRRRRDFDPLRDRDVRRRRRRRHLRSPPLRRTPRSQPVTSAYG
jgi:hypothetical protein